MKLVKLSWSFWCSCSNDDYKTITLQTLSYGFANSPKESLKKKKKKHGQN